MTQASLQRLIITFKPEELFLHALYGLQEGLSLNAKARRQDVQEHGRSGLTQTLEALDE
jgi:hypothetical protein